jgi:hypothetical protein
MQDVLQSTFGQLVIGLAGLLMLTVVGVYFALRFRDENDSTESSADLLTKFREMRHEGHINEDEFRHITTDLKGKLSQQSSAESVDRDGFDLQG